MDSGFNTFTDHVARIQARAWTQDTGSKVGFPIRKSSDQSSFAAPQGLSQRTTSFIASQRQGIHRMPLRHLIALMIDVRRSAATHIAFRKTISAPKTPGRPRTGAPMIGNGACRTRPIRLQAAGAASSLGHVPSSRCQTSADRERGGESTMRTPAPGGARRDRTDDLMLAKHALSQLSYGPESYWVARDPWWAWDDSNVRPHPYQGCALNT